MFTEPKLLWVQYAEHANDSRKDLNKAIERAESRLASIYGWRCLFTYRIFIIIRLFWILSKFKGETDELFKDVDEKIKRENVVWCFSTVNSYNCMLEKYRKDIIELFALVDQGSPADPETRFNAYTYGGRIG